MQTNPVIVVGAGIVGICCALAIQRRGRDVLLLDRAAPASETSYGNAGVICTSGIFPMAHPSLLRRAPRLLTNRDPRLNIPYSELPRLAPWLWRFALRCTSEKSRQGTESLIDLTRDALGRHLELMFDAGVSNLLQDSGWLQLFRSDKSFQSALADAEICKQSGLPVTTMSSRQLARFEPDIGHIYSGAIWMESSHTVSDPAALGNAYLDLFLTSGGAFRQNAVTRLHPGDHHWQVVTDCETYTAENVVIASGAWSNGLLQPLGIKLPYVIERGYHMMFDYPSNGQLGRSVIDRDLGYVITPMQQGLRATTASNLVSRERKPDPRQLYKLMPEMQRTFAMGKPQIKTPWMGRRTATADSLPLIGPHPSQPGLLVATGHGHLGLTMAPITGELIADELFDSPNPACKPFYPDRRI